jgi:hypothetical protein
MKTVLFYRGCSNKIYETGYFIKRTGMFGLNLGGWKVQTVLHQLHQCLVRATYLHESLVESITWRKYKQEQ